jgi:hypothetical protein
MEAEQGQVAVRAAVQALDAALAEHRRGLALAASRRERERMEGARAIKPLAAASAAALEQPVDRPVRLLRLAETWIEVDRSRQRLDPGVHAEVQAGELRVRGDGWSARIVLAPGDGPAAAAADAAARIDVAARCVALRARNRLDQVVATGTRHAAACHAAATALAAADRELAERHADHARVAAAAAELEERLGAWRLGEAPELAAARDRLAQARAHLAAVPEEPYAWVGALEPATAGAMLRDLPADRLDGTRDAVVALTAAVRDDEPVLALAATPGGAAAVTSERVWLDGEAHAPEAVEDEQLGGLAEERPGRVAAALELVRAARRAGPVPPPAAAPRDDPVELLARLGELRDRGVIDRAEFEAKKAELLDRI